jgi:hypothetical protein
MCDIHTHTHTHTVTSTPSKQAYARCHAHLYVPSLRAEQDHTHTHTHTHTRCHINTRWSIYTFGAQDTAEGGPTACQLEELLFGDMLKASAAASCQALHGSGCDLV